MIAPLWISGLILYICLSLLLPWRRMPFLGAYVALGGVRTLMLMGTALFAPTRAYWGVYWPLQGIGYVLSASVALALILSVTRDPRRRLDLQTLIALVFVLPFIACLGAGEWRPWLMAAKWADLAVMWLLLYALILKPWPQPQAGLAYGLIIGMLGHVACALVQEDGDPAQWLRMLYQLAGVAQLAVWVWALSANHARRRPYEPAEGL